jgi:hypothetical protein
MAQTVDLRGRQAPVASSAVLADPSGRRARILARTGRVVALLFCVWLAGLGLAGLGILPTGAVPLGSKISGSSPPVMSRTVPPKQPAAADLVGARPATSRLAAAGAGGAAAITGQASGSRLASVGAGSHGSAHHGAGASNGGRGSPSTTAGHPGSRTGAGTTSGAATTSGGQATAPGQTVKTQNPGHTKTVTPGSSGSAPGQVKQTSTTTTPGNSGSAPGQNGTRGSGGGHRH